MHWRKSMVSMMSTWKPTNYLYNVNVTAELKALLVIFQ